MELSTHFHNSGVPTANWKKHNSKDETSITSAPVVIESSNSDVVMSPCVGISPSKLPIYELKKS